MIDSRSTARDKIFARDLTRRSRTQDLREAVTTLEETERTARRVLGARTSSQRDGTENLVMPRPRGTVAARNAFALEHARPRGREDPSRPRS